MDASFREKKYYVSVNVLQHVNNTLIVEQAKVNLDSFTEYEVGKTLTTKSAAFSIHLQPFVNRIKV
jgi:hypothetical protein